MIVAGHERDICTTLAVKLSPEPLIMSGVDRDLRYAPGRWESNYHALLGLAELW